VTLDEAGILEDREVLHESRQRHREGLREIADRCRTFAQPREHGAPRGIRERAEDDVEAARFMVNHLVKYSPARGLCQAFAQTCAAVPTGCTADRSA